MIYYKVVKCRNKKLYSSIAGCNYRTLQFYKKFKAVRYIKNKWVKSKDSNNPKLWVTNNLDDARHILLGDVKRHGSKGFIYECEVENPKSLTGLIFDSFYLVDAVKITRKVE